MTEPTDLELFFAALVPGFSVSVEQLVNHCRDLRSQDDLRVDHGDICGDNYSRAMFEAQQDSAS